MSYGYLEKMLKMLTSAYTRRDLQNLRHNQPLETNIGKVFSLFATGLEIIRENAELVRLWDNIDNAEGAVLDRYGANFGVERGAASDGLYRILIRVKMIAQLSGGDDDTVIRAAGELLGVDFSDILLEDVFPAKKALYVDQSLLSQERLDLIEQIAYAIKRILVAGVGLRLYLRTYRTYRSDLHISHGGAVGAAFLLLPVGQDRAYDYPVDVKYGSFLRPELTPLLVGEDKTFAAPVFVAHSGFLEPTLPGLPPDTERPLTARQSAAGGAMYHTHIKSKRID